MKRVFIVRHGQTDYNIAQRWQGHLDIPLNASGRKQARALAAYLAKERFDAVYASDLSRAFETAEIIARSHQLVVNPEPRLRELHLGELQGKTREEMTQGYAQIFRQWQESDDFQAPGGESRRMSQERVFKFWQEIVMTHAAKSLLLVTHGGTLRMLFRRLFNDSDAYRFGNTSLSILDQISDDKWKIVAVNTTPHLIDQADSSKI